MSGSMSENDDLDIGMKKNIAGRYPAIFVEIVSLHCAQQIRTDISTDQPTAATASALLILDP